MNNETHKPTLDLSEIRKEVGGALWLLVTYADMAAKGCSVGDDDLARVLGTSTVTILRWKIRLIESGLISVEQAQSGQTILVVPRDGLYANSIHGASDQLGADEPDLGEESASLNTTDREFLRECGIEVEETFGLFISHPITETRRSKEPRQSCLKSRYSQFCSALVC